MRYRDQDTRRVRWVARIRIRSDLDFFRGMVIQITGHVIDTQRTKMMIFIYSPRFAENSDVPHTRLVD